MTFGTRSAAFRPSRPLWRTYVTVPGLTVRLIPGIIHPLSPVITMPRPRNPNPPVSLEIVLRPETKAKLEILLFSQAEGRVPKGAWSQFFQLLADRALDQITTNQGATHAHER